MDFDTMIGSMLEAEDFENLIRQLSSSFVFSEKDANENVINLFNLYKSLFGETEAQNWWKKVDIPCFLSLIFGTEESVNLRREVSILRENIFNEIQRDEQLCMISSGSLGEGVVSPPSDDDIMVFPKSHLRVRQSYEYTKQTYGPIMLPSKLSPGYCLLLDADRLCRPNVISIINERRYISSSLYKKMFQESNSSVNLQIHGPCTRFTTGSLTSDVAWCLICPQWPSVASEWITRDRHYEWPSSDMIQSIVRSGCHVVPIGDPDSDYRDHEWRISFSLAERTLVHSFNHAQFLTYNLLRYALKSRIDKQFSDVLCSYFMKTTLFHTIERTSRQMWNVDNLEICLIVSLSVLYYFIDNKNCPNYFIPKYNMIKKKVTDTNKQPLLDLIRYLIKIRIFGVLPPYWIFAYCNKTSFLKFVEFSVDSELFKSHHVDVATEPLLPIENNLPFDHEGHITFMIRMLTYCSQKMDAHNGFLNIILHTGIMYHCQSLMSNLWSSKKQNKQSYIIHKTIRTILQGLKRKGKLTLGKLTLASYSYLVGKTKLGILEIQKLMSKYPSYAIESTSMAGNLRYMKMMCSMGYSLNYKARHAWAPHFKLRSFDLNAYPSPMKIWISTAGGVFLHPCTFAFLMESLGHIQLQDMSSLMTSTDNLLNLLGKLETNYDIACTKMCIGIIKLEQGDGESAYKWFRSAYMMKDELPLFGKETVCVSALMYITSLIYNKRFLLESNLKNITIVPTDFDLD